MLLLYNLGVRFYFILIWVASHFNKKANLWVKGRKNIKYRHFDKSAWFHFASLGEYEQGLPVLLSYRAQYPSIPIVITFFSPSGYEIRKNTPYADAVYYLPLDTAANAQHFINAIKPSIAIFTKYEYWYHYFYALNRAKVPLFIISGIFRPGQVFFKWYGGLHHSMLGFVTRFFVQDEDSKTLLNHIGIDNVTVSGDTRFDRVWANAKQPKELSLIEQFIQGKKVFIAGSTWLEDERLVSFLPELYPDWKFIIAPHEINEEKITALLNKFPIESTWLYSHLVVREKVLVKIQATTTKPSPFHTLDWQMRETQTLIIDNIGMLSSLYQYGKIAYIGGGFGVGIHNTLEAAAFGLPVIFGPNYEKFKEARDMVSMQIGFSIGNEDDLKNIFHELVKEDGYKAISPKVKEYVKEHTGATETIMNYINSLK
jgi:3-deoxy-D-manno-octulosonic-acid transferase